MKKLSLLLMMAFILPWFAPLANASSVKLNARNSYTGTVPRLEVVETILVDRANDPVIGSTDWHTFAKSFTMMAWYKIHEWSTNASYGQCKNVLIGHQQRCHANDNGSFLLAASESGLIYKGKAHVTDGSEFQHSAKGTFTDAAKVVKDEWFNLAFTYDLENTRIYVYLNGEKVGEEIFDEPLSIFPDNPGIFTFGGAGAGAFVDDAAIYDRVLSQKEIYAAMEDPTKGDPICLYTFDDITDANGAPNHGSRDEVCMYYNNSGSSQATGNINIYAQNAAVPTIGAEDRPAYTAPKLVETVTDVINTDFIGVAGNTYQDWSGKTGASGVVYSGKTNVEGTTFGIRSNGSDCGIIVTNSASYARKITINFSESLTATRTVNVYGSDKPFTAVSNLFANDAQKIGAITFDADKDELEYAVSLEIEGDYRYIGLRSSSAAIYIEDIKIDWEKIDLGPTHNIAINITGEGTVGITDEDGVGYPEGREIPESKTVTIAFVPAQGYVLKSATFKNVDLVQSDLVVDGKYTVNGLTEDVALDVVYEKTPITYPVTDVIDATLAGIVGSNYAAWEGKKASSDAVYAGFTCDSKGGVLQIKAPTASIGSGVVTTQSGGIARKIKVTFNENTTNSYRKLEVFGSHSAYTSANDLANAQMSNAIAELTRTKSGEKEEVEVTLKDDYEYVAFTSYYSALYIDKIEITWDDKSYVAPKHTVTIANPEDGTVTVTDADGNAIASGAEVAEDAVITLAATPAEGYVLNQFTINGTPIEGSTYKMGTEDVTVSATFELAVTYANPAVALHATYTDKECTRLEFPSTVVLPSTSGLHYENTMASMTMSAWVKMGEQTKSQVDAPAPLLGHRAQNYDNSNGTMFIAVDAANKLNLKAGADNLAATKTFDYAMVADEWTYVTLTYDLDSNTWSVYANGDLIGQAENAKSPVGMFQDTPLKAGDELYFGNMFFVGNNSLELTVDEVQFFNRALSAAEVAKAYDNAADKVEGLVAKYTFDAPLAGYRGYFPNTVEGGSDVKAYLHTCQFNTYEWAWKLSNVVEAKAEYAEGRTLPQEYCIPTAKTNNHAARATKALNIKNDRGESLDITGLQSKGMKSDIYFDRTDEAVTLQAGTTVTVTPTADGEWMHNYLFIDWNKDGVFTPILNETSVPQAGSELVAHTGYSATGESPMYTSTGDYCTGNGKNYGTLSDVLPAFVIPADVKPGAYRARYKVSWNTVDPCNNEGDPNNPLDAMGGIVVDFTINVVKDAHEMRTITIATNDAELGKVEFVGVEVEGDSYTTTDNVTVKATATDADAYFVNWTDGDNNVVAETEEFEYKGDAEITLTANFRQHYAVTFDAAEGIRVATEAGAITSGSIFDRGTELTVTVNAPAGKQLAALTVNDTDVTADMEGNTYTFELASATTIAATYEDLKAALTISVEGNGKVVVETAEGVTYEDGDEIPYGTEFTISFIPDAGEDLESAIIDDYDWMENKADMTDLGNGAYAVDYDATEATVTISAKFTDRTNALESIEAAINSGAEYFNLQGVRVDNQNIVPGIYIRRAEGKVNKVLVK